MANGIPVGAISYGDLLDLELPPRQPIVDRWVNQGENALIAGSPGVGKTFCELEMARATASGRTFLCHFPTTQGRVLIIDEESNIRGIQDRLRMMERANPIGKDAEIHFAIAQGYRFDTPAGVEFYDGLLRTLQPVLVFGDSLTRLHGANENDAGQMADVFRNVTALGRAHNASFVLLDHLRKKGLLNDPDEMLRGSTEKKAWPDSIFFLEGSGVGQITISQLKARWGEPITPFQIELRVDRDAETVELAYLGDAPKHEQSRGVDIVKAIHELQKELGPDGADAVKIAAWLECSPDTVQRHAKKLVAAEILTLRSVQPSEKGGRPKMVYDVKGGRD